MYRFLPAFGLLLLFHSPLVADEPLARRIDALIEAKAKGKAFSGPADDAEFLRRVYLDFAGRIPSSAEARAFLDDKTADSRSKIIDRLLASPDYATRLAERFSLMLTERLGEHPQWLKYLQQCFAQNRPWDRMARDMLGAEAAGDAAGAAFFLSKRLENYGQNPVDYPALTRDIGRLFLGKDLRCAQCHDHLFIEDYKQHDFQGLYAFVKNVSLRKADVPAVTEGLTTAKVEFTSVFVGEKKATGPRLPGRDEVAIPTFPKGQEYLEPPDKKKQTPGIPKFSTLKTLAEELPAPQNVAFNRNIVNRLWFMLMGRGLIHPLDLDHGKNPPSHPELLDLLAREFVAHKYDIRWLLGELARTQVYQRSSRLPADVKEVEPAEFRTAIERRLEPEPLVRALLEATGEKVVKGGATFESARAGFVKAFAYPQREPEDEFAPSLKGALFLLNDKLLLSWLEPKKGNLVDRLAALADANVADEAYLSILTRRPTARETQEVVRFLDDRKERRPAALRNLAWALLASTEFYANH